MSESDAKKAKKEQKKSASCAAEASPQVAGPSAEAAAGADSSSSTSLQRDQLLDLLKQSGAGRVAASYADKDKAHEFWGTQPVPKMGEEVASEDSGPLDEPKTIADVRADPYPLPAAFKWEVCDINDDAVLTEIYTLLNENYVEDDEATFRFDYSKEFLRWALSPPGYHSEWIIGVRVAANAKLVAFITAIPSEMVVRGTEVKMAEVNFLCVHKKLRAKRLAPVLIKEVTRRVNLRGIWQAAYTAGVLLPKPVGRCRYWHRSINAKKLVDIGFSNLGPRMTMKRQMQLLKMPAEPATPNLRKMQEKDCAQVATLLNDYLKKFMLHPIMTVDEVRHWLLPREGVVHSYVRGDQNGKVTDMCSLYLLPSSVLSHAQHKTLFAGYSFWNVATSVPLKQLMQDLLILGRDEANLDVFNALDLMDNDKDGMLADLKFAIGSGHLHYYLYNWKCAEIKPSEVGLVLL